MVHLTTPELYDHARAVLETDAPPFAEAVCGVTPLLADLTTVLERVDCPRCRLVAAGEGRTDAEPPITRWRAAARSLGISEDTLARRRREHDPSRECFFVSREDLLAWWIGLSKTSEQRRAILPSAPASAIPRPPAPRGKSGPVDFDALAAKLTGGAGGKKQR